MNKTATSQTNPTSKPPVSERKASANRANAQHSTGPRTPQGKAASSLNALRHGILARAAFNVTIEGEERRAEFDALVAGFAQEYQPRTLTEHMTVQQLAGCYWKLAKIWTHETEAAWRRWFGPSMPLEEMKEYEDFNDLNMERMIETVSVAQNGFFPKVGLGKPTIPTGASANTILRYQGAINTMMTRCITLLERRRKALRQSDEAFEEVDYINEPTAKEASPETAEAEQEPAEKAAPSQDLAKDLAQDASQNAPNDARSHKRTQKDALDASLSSHEEVGAEKPAVIEDKISSEKPPGKA